jgi:hypothetical protein
MSSLGAVLAGGLLLLWPAVLNGYPLVFSDTGAFLHQTLGPLMIWDKPWVYGPMLHGIHWRLTLWLPALAQGVMLSWLVWLTQRAVRGRASAPAHLWLLAGLAALTATPWVASLLMPDLFAPAIVLALFLLASGTLSRAERAGLLLLATLGIAAHLSHLPLAAALVLLLALLRRAWLPAVPLAAALALLLATNLVGHGRLALSPYGASFLLARLQADGPATRTLRAACPAAGWELCGAVARLPMDSDDFLWHPDSPLNRTAGGQARDFGSVALAPEARAILAETFRREPLGVAAAMLANALRQLAMAKVGDALVPDHLAVTVAARLAQGFPVAEQARFAASLQAQGTLPAAAEPLLAPQRWVLLLGGALALLAWRRSALWGDRQRLALVLCVLVGVSANAFATGALSGPHHRYQARIAWLLPLAGVLCWRPPTPGRPSEYD